ncbi:MAG: outer membrane protein OmpA-like peptidoglycan-associated protein [Flavobacteriales bacterium]|jgi:outer membrane protein OmpA-like peptidoglycan-associated protein
MKKSLIVFFFYCFISLSAQEKLALFFDFNRDVINEKSVVDFRTWLQTADKVTILKIEGFCDSIATTTYNKKLASRRVNTVFELLENNAIPINDKIELNAVGENFPQSKNQSENRKVIVYYQFSKIINVKVKGPIAIVDKTKQQQEELSAQPQNSTLLHQLENAKVGDLIQLQNLNFYFNSEKIMTESEPILANLLNALKMNTQLKINIHGHICCNIDPNDVKLSYRRSKFIFDYLIRNGIATERLGHRGFGSSKPLYRLPERNEAERVANRRVEILIMQK